MLPPGAVLNIASLRKILFYFFERCVRFIKGLSSHDISTGGKGILHLYLLQSHGYYEGD